MRILVLVILTIFVSFTVYAEKVSLSVEQSVELGLKSNTFIKISELDTDYMRYKKKEMFSYLLPEMKVTGSYTQFKPTDPSVIHLPITQTGVDIAMSPGFDDSASMKFTVQQPVFTGFKVLNSYKAARFRYMAQEETHEKNTAEVAFAIRSSYWSIYKAVKVSEFTNENLKQTEAHLIDVKNFFSQGMVTKNEVLKVEIQFSKAKLRKIDAENAVELATLHLCVLTGLPTDTEILVTSEPNVDSDQGVSVDTLLQTAYKNRHDLSSLDLQRQAGQYELKSAKAGFWPQIFFIGNYSYSRPDQQRIPATDEFHDNWDIGCYISLSVWNWGRTLSEIGESRVRLEKITELYDQQKDTIREEVTEIKLTIKKLRMSLDVNKDIVSQAEENYRITNDMFQNGVAINTDLLDAEQELLKAKTDYYQVLADYETAKAKLTKVLGL